MSSNQKYPIHSFSIDAFKQHAKQLRAHLKAKKGIELKQTEALHAIASQWNFPNWQTMVAVHERGRAEERVTDPAIRSAIERLGKTSHVFQPSDDPLDDRLEATRSHILHHLAASPVLGPTALLGTLGAARPQGLTGTAPRAWLDVASAIAETARRCIGTSDIGDQADNYLLQVADLLVREIFEEKAKIYFDPLMRAYATEYLSPVDVARVLASGFFGDTSEGIRRTFAFHYGIARQYSAG